MNGHDLGAEEVLVERRLREGWVFAEDDAVTVVVMTELDDELRLEGCVLDLIHKLNTMRKEVGFVLMDRITVVLPQSDADLLAHETWIKEEVLATEIRTDGISEPQIGKV